MRLLMEPEKRTGDDPSGMLLVLCHDGVVLGPFETYAEALAAGKSRCDLDRFTIMRDESQDSSAPEPG